MITRKKIMIAAALFAGLVILSIILWFIFRYDKVEIKVDVTPSDSTFTIDDKPAQSGTIWLEKGIHTLKASRKEFEDAILTINTDQLDTSQAIYLHPKPVSDAAFEWLLQHPDEQLKREEAGAIEATKKQDELLALFPVLTDLPHETLDYKIEYSNPRLNEIEFGITLYPISPKAERPNSYREELQQYKKEALDFLKSKGVDVTRSKITITPDPDKE